MTRADDASQRDEAESVRIIQRALHLYQLHRVDPAVPVADTWGAFADEPAELDALPAPVGTRY